jgi:sarcosine oxidase subunit gamma
VTVPVLRRSPLGEWAARLEALAPDVQVVEQPFLTHLTLRLDDPAAVGAALGVDFPSQPCTFTGNGSIEVAWLGPDEYLLIAPPDRAVELEAVVREALADSPGAVVDVSAQRTTVALSGPRVRDLLAHGCSIDLHPAVAVTGTCVQTLLARTGVILLVRDAERGEFGVLVRASFAEYFAAWVSDAGRTREWL